MNFDSKTTKELKFEVIDLKGKLEKLAIDKATAEQDLAALPALNVASVTKFDAKTVELTDAVAARPTLRTDLIAKNEKAIVSKTTVIANFATRQADYNQNVSNMEAEILRRQPVPVSASPPMPQMSSVSVPTSQDVHTASN